MMTLAFDTSSQTASVAILRDNVVLYDTIIDKGLNHSEVLLPAINEALLHSGVKLPEIDLLACTLGPGSFTGLRIGVGTLKGLMMATAKPAAGVSSLAALALNVRQKDKIIGAMMDAGRGQVYLACYQYDRDGRLEQTAGARALDPQSLADVDQKNIIYVGDGAIRYADLLNTFRSQIEIASAQQQFIHAAAVGELAIEKYLRHDLLNLAGCVPVYLRQADAQFKKPPLS